MSFFDQFGQNLNNILEGVSGKNEYELQRQQQQQQQQYLDLMMAETNQDKGLPVWAIGLIVVVFLLIGFLLLKMNKVV
jgi:type VI protein secretion system component VasF